MLNNSHINKLALIRLDLNSASENYLKFTKKIVKLFSSISLSSQV